MKKKLFPLLLFLILLSSCNEYKLPKFDLDPSINYSSFDEYKLDNMNNLFNQEEDVYALYLYNEDCESCKEIKNSMLGYLNEFKNEKRHFKVYLYNSIRLKNEFIQYKNDKDNYNDIHNYYLNNEINNVKDMYFTFVPSLYVVKFGKVEDYYTGKDCIKYIFETSYDSRSYDCINDYKLNSLDDFYSLNDNKYIVYLYYKTCPYCMKVRGYLYNYLLNSHKTNIYIYDMKTKNEDEGILNRSKFKSFEGNYDDFIKEMNKSIKEGINTLEDTYYKYVPSMYMIENNYLKEYLDGSDNIKTYLSSLK